MLLETCDGFSKADSDGINRIISALELANSKQPTYSNVHPRNVILVPANSLQRTVKGTIRRAEAEAMVFGKTAQNYKVWRTS